MSTNVNVIRRLTLYVVASLAITVLAVVTLGFMLRQSVRDSADLTNVTLEKLGRSHTVSEQLSSVHGAVQQMLVLKDPDEMEKKLEEIETGTQRMETLAVGCGDAGAEILKRFKALAATEKKVVDLLLLGNAAQANELFITTGGPQFNDVLLQVRGYHRGVEEATRHELDARRLAARQALLWRCAGIGVALCLMAGYGWSLKSTIARKLRGICAELAELSHRLTAASAEVSTSSSTLAEGASEQAASVEETSASLEEMSSMVKRNAASAQQAKDLAGQTRAAADSGVADVQAMQRSMAEIKGAGDAVARIVKSIDEIAFQTNILALNAAVEAARAGEAGAGFAVVAEEVRNLAQRSAGAARESAGLIEDVIQKTDRGVQVSTSVAGSLQEITTRVRAVDELVAEISVACNEQAQGIAQISVAVTQIDKITQSASARAEETASTAGELQRYADAQRETVNEMLSLVGGSGVVPGLHFLPAGSAAGTSSGVVPLHRTLSEVAQA